MIEIVPGLYTRGHLRVGTRPSELEEVGISLAVSLTTQGEPSLSGWGGYLHWPMSDGGRVDEARLLRVARRVAKTVTCGESVLVMCHAGRNRTGLVVCAALRELLGVSGDEALRMFRERRPRGVANAAFERYLCGLPAREKSS